MALGYRRYPTVITPDPETPPDPPGGPTLNPYTGPARVRLRSKNRCGVSLAFVGVFWIYVAQSGVFPYLGTKAPNPRNGRFSLLGTRR